MSSKRHPEIDSFLISDSRNESGYEQVESRSFSGAVNAGKDKSVSTFSRPSVAFDVDDVKSLRRSTRSRCKTRASLDRVPQKGQMIEVLWHVGSDSEESGDDEDWRDNPRKSFAKERKSRSQVWWPAMVIEGSQPDTLSLQYCKSPTSCDSQDLDEPEHEIVSFLDGDKVKHGPGSYCGTIASWRPCSWNAGIIAKDVEVHDECRSACIQLSNRVGTLEAQVQSLKQIISDSLLSSVDLESNARKAILDRMKAMLRTYIFSSLHVPSDVRTSQKRKASWIQYRSEHDSIITRMIKSLDIDCTLSEFLELVRDASKKCEEDVQVQPSAFRGSFLNLRSRDTIRLVFRSFGSLCDTLGIQKKTSLDLSWQVSQSESGFACFMRLVGFSIMHHKNGFSSDTILLGKGSSYLQSTGTETVNVLRRPESRWNKQQHGYETAYIMEVVSRQVVRSRYLEAFRLESPEMDSKPCSDLKASAMKRVADFKDFEIALEWNRKNNQVHSAYAATTLAQDVLGSVSCSVPCVDIRNKGLCRNVFGILNASSRGTFLN